MSERDTRPRSAETPGAILPPPSWQRALAYLDRGTILVLGAQGSGKTSLARWLLGQLDRGLDRVALVDCDQGQTTVGVPGCLGMAITGPWEAPAALWFVGAISPPGHLLPIVVGAAKLTERARARGAQAVILDSSGLLCGAVGRLLDYHLALATGVDQVLAIADGRPGPRRDDAAGEHDAVEAVLTLLRGDRRRVERLAPAPAARDRSPADRRDHRRRRFAAHLRGARTRWVSPRRIYAGDWQPGGGLAPGTVVGLLDDEGFCLGLGIVEETHPDRVAIYTAVGEVPVVRIQAGSFRLDREGCELGPADGPAAAG